MNFEKIIKSTLIEDKERGDLIVYDKLKIPFEIKRIFIINNVPVGEKRGNHSHKSCAQVLVCNNGKIKIDMYFKHGSGFMVLKKSDIAFVDKMVWSSQEYLEPNSELMVLCSHEYDKEDYITDFEEFKKLTNGK